MIHGYRAHRLRLALVGVLIVAMAPVVQAQLFQSTEPVADAVGDPVIAAAGDIACDPTNNNFNGGNGANGACAQKATNTLITQMNPAAVLPLGDNQYYCGGYNAYLQSYNLSWGQQLAKTYPVVGNHEYLTSGGTDCNSANANASGHFRYFSNAAQVGASNQLWYSYNIGSWHLIALNSNCGNVGGCSSSSAQGQWLAADLAANTAPCTLAYWHIPVWTSGGRAASNMVSVTNQLYNAGADVVLTGHDHIYERFAPQNAQGQLDNANGIRAFVVGSGGANHTSLASTVPNSVVRNDSTYGVLKMTLHAESYDWNFLPIAGQTFTDSGTGSCHNATGSQPPTAPALTVTESDGNDFVSGSTVYYRPGASGGFSVGATSTGAASVQFPVVFGGDGATDTTSPFSKSYAWNASATNSGPFTVTATNANGSASSQFTVTKDGAPPSTTASCNGGSCAGTLPSPVTVSLASTDVAGGSGVQSTYFTLDGTDPTTSASRVAYSGPFTIASTTTVRYSAIDNVSNVETPGSETVTIGGAGGGGAVALVQQKSASGSSVSTLPVTLNAPSGAGRALVATIAVAAGSSASVSSVTDPSGGAWTQGPVGFLSGANSRVEIWYRLGAPSVTSATVTLSAAKSMAVTVSEWSGVTTAIDGSVGGSGASSTSLTTATLNTSNPTDLLIGAVNYPANATSTLTSSGFTNLNDFSTSSSVHGRAAYRVTSATGAYQAAWTLSAASGGHGTALLALKAAAAAPDTTPPTDPAVALSTSDANDFVNGSQVFYNPSAGSGAFTASTTTADTESPVSVQFPNVFTANDGGGAQTSEPYSRTYGWSAGATASGSFTVTATSAGGSSTGSFTATPDSTHPVSTIACNGGSCGGSFGGPVTVALGAADGASGVRATYYTTDGSNPLTGGTLYAAPFTVSTTTTVRFATVDNVSNAETPKSQVISTSTVDTTPPSTPALTLSTSDTNDYVSGTEVFYNPSNSTGMFAVTAATSDPESPVSVQFPDVFSAGDGGAAQTAAPFVQAYSWSSGASAAGQFTVAASSAGGGPSAASFTVTPDSTVPDSTITCNNGSCAAPFTSAVSVSLASTDAGSGVSSIYYTTDNTDPASSATRVLYTGPFTVSATTTVRYAAFDNVSNAEPAKSAAITVDLPAITLVQQATAGASGAATLPVSLTAPSGVGNTLVATIALAAGSSASVSTVTDSSGATWTRGPVGYLSGANSRVEIWYRLGAPSITGLTVTLSAAKSMGTTVSEWSGVGSVVDVSASGSGASATTVTSPSLTTLNANDLVIAAVNYASNTTSTLTSSAFTSLNDFNASSSVHGRAAYLRTTSTGSYQAAWNLAAASGGHGTAIIALRGAS